MTESSAHKVSVGQMFRHWQKNCGNFDTTMCLTLNTTMIFHLVWRFTQHLAQNGIFLCVKKTTVWKITLDDLSAMLWSWALRRFWGSTWWPRGFAAPSSGGRTNPTQRSGTRRQPVQNRDGDQVCLAFGGGGGDQEIFQSFFQHGYKNRHTHGNKLNGNKGCKLDAVKTPAGR